MLSLLALIVTLATGCASTLAGDWTRDALRLTGESDLVRREAIKNLRANPKLKDILKTELQGPRFALALDVVTALRLHAFLPGLLRVAATDETGAFYLAINSLAKPKETREIAKLYRERLVCGEKCDAAPFPARIVMLDALARLGNMLSVIEVERLLEDESPEVRASALSYARLALVRDRRPEYLAIAQHAIRLDPPQLRLQALHLLTELAPEMREKAKTLATEYCGEENSGEVRDACRKLQKGGS